MFDFAGRPGRLIVGVLLCWAGVESHQCQLPSAPSLLKPVDTSRPDTSNFPALGRHHVSAVHTEVQGPKATNKFWTNWIIAEGVHEAIFPMPYTLKWGMNTELLVSHGVPRHVYGTPEDTGPSRIRYFRTPIVGEFGLGSSEAVGEYGFTVTREGLFGVDIEVRPASAPKRKVVYPIYSGMAYVSGHYFGLTPRITSERSLARVQRVRGGVWSFVNNGQVEFRVYVLDMRGRFVDESFDFDSSGILNKPLQGGWVRMAHVLGASDVAVLDDHARAILSGCSLQVLEGGIVQYDFLNDGDAGVPVLHWAYAHHLSLLRSQGPECTRLAHGLTPSRTPSKGLMHGVVGHAWTLVVDLEQVASLGYLPEGEPHGDRAAFLRQEVEKTLEYFSKTANWQATMFKKSFYWSGKGFQKVSSVCLLAEKFLGTGHPQTQACAHILLDGFRCLYDRTSANNCVGAPLASYDSEWGGIVSREGYHEGCQADYGNACYNDHHYHYGYWVVSAATLVKLMPSQRDNHRFVGFVNALIRDTTNPSTDDRHFPQFRSFDWFDLHSWSRGVLASADGKDEESTSEELNLMYGIQLWGAAIGDGRLRSLGSTMLAFCTVTIREFFLLRRGNPHHHPDFTKNHVTGVFFQNKVDYATWFGWNEAYIHGIQMLPVTPALSLTRTADYTREVWEDVLGKLPVKLDCPWTSLVLTAGLAPLDPDRAYGLLQQMDPGHMDDGLTRVWALYWAAAHADPNRRRIV